MASTYSPNLRIELIGTGEQAGTWGTTTNTNLGTLLEGAIAGYTTVSVTSANQALTTSNGGVDQARPALLRFTTTTAANFNVYAPPVSKIYIIANDSGYSATIYNSTVIGNTTAAGLGVTIPTGTVVQVWSNGTNFSSTDLVDPILANSAVVSSASTGTALTVTQTGTGNAFVVQDESPDNTPFVIDNSGRVISGYTTYRAFNYAATPRFQINGTDATSGAVTSVVTENATGAVSGSLLLGRTRGTQASPSTVAFADDLGRIQFEGYAGTTMQPAAAIIGQSDASSGTGDMPGRLTFWTTPDGTTTLTERMRIDNAGRIGIGGPASTSISFGLYRNITGGATAWSLYNNATVQPDVATGAATAVYYTTSVATASNSGVGYTIKELYHYSTVQGTFHADSTVNNQYGYVVSNNITGAITNVGLYGNLSSGTNATIQSVSADGTTATITTTAAHGFKVGQLVEVDATTNTSLNGVFTVTAITDTPPGPYTFQYARAVTISAIADTGTAYNLSRWFIYNNSSAPSWFAGRAIIDTSSGASALRITQRGTGNAITVEDSTNPDSTPFVVDADGYVVLGSQTRYGTYSGSTPGLQLISTSTGQSSVLLQGTASGSGTAPILNIANASSTNAGVVASGNTLGAVRFYGGDGVGPILAAQIECRSDGTPGVNDMPGRIAFLTTPSGSASPLERMRINSAGEVGIGTASLTGAVLSVGKNITGSTTAIGVVSSGQIQSDVAGGSSAAWMFRSSPSTVAASFTLNTLLHFGIAPTITFGAGTTVNAQYGFASSNGMTGATTNIAFIAQDIGGAAATTGKTNYGFYSNVSTSTGGGTAWNFYANGTAPNFFKGSLFAGNAASDTIGGIASRVQISGTDSGGSGISVARWSADANPSYLTLGKSRGATIGTVAAVSSGDNIGAIQFAADDGDVSGTLPVAASIVAAVDGAVSTNDMPGRLVFNTATDGTATLTERMRIDNLGRIGIGGAASTNTAFNISNDITNAITGSAYSLLIDSPIKSDATTAAGYVRTSAATSSNAGTPYTVGALYHYLSNQGTLHADSTVTSQYGFAANTNLTGATNNYAFFAANTGGASATTGKTNYGFRSDLDTATGGGTAWNFYANGTAANYFKGAVQVVGSLGYTTGAGGTVTQATSRTTGVTLNKVTGAITLVSAAGSTAWQSFTVTNSTVAATDTVIVNQKSGTDIYMIHVTAVAAGSFRITFATTGGTTTEQPVFNFAVIKGVTS